MRCVQPWAAKKVVDALSLKPTGTKFPYGWGIVLIVSPIVIALFDSLGYHLIIHFAARLRAALFGLVYEKLLQLNEGVDSTIDTEKFLNLVSADVRQVGERLASVVYLLCTPIYTFIAFFILICTFSWPIIFVMFASLGLCILQGVFLIQFIRNHTQYLLLNDTRTKLVNETLQGIRTVKYPSLEKIFVDKINVTRLQQNEYSASAQFWLQISVSFMRISIPTINCITFAFIYYRSKESTTYKIGRIIMYIPIKIKEFLRGR